MTENLIRTFSDDKALVDERRKQIIKTASSLFIKKGYDRTTIRELAKALNCSTGSLYHYIGSKDDILRLVLNFSTDRNQFILRYISKNTAKLGPVQALQKSIKVFIESIDEYQDMHIFLNHIMVDLKPQDREIVYENQGDRIKYFADLLRKGIETGEFNSNNPELAAYNIVVIINNWASRRWFLRKRYSLEEYISVQTELILKMIGVKNS